MNSPYRTTVRLNRNDPLGQKAYDRLTELQKQSPGQSVSAIVAGLLCREMNDDTFPPVRETEKDDGIAAELHRIADTLEEIRDALQSSPAPSFSVQSPSDSQTDMQSRQMPAHENENASEQADELIGLFGF